MFPNAYFAKRFFPDRYFPIGDLVILGIVGPGVCRVGVVFVQGPTVGHVFVSGAQVGTTLS